MFDRRRVSKVAAIVAVLAGTALAATAQGGAHAAGGSGTAGARASDETTIRIHVSGCDACTIQPQNARKGLDDVTTFPARKVGSDHVVVYKLFKVDTRGLSFVVSAPWANDLDYRPNAVTAYSGHKVGSSVGGKAARHAKSAAGCWAGTKKSTKDLYFRVGRIHTRSHGHQVVAPLVYAPRTMSSWKPYVKAARGTIGNQDAFFCVKP